jgi:hypothetical protein
MLYTISWMVEREPQAERHRARAEVLAWFLLGGLAGGALMGSVIALLARTIFYLSGSPPLLFLGAAAVVAAAYAGQAAALWRVPRPQFHHQVPESWRNIFSRKVASFVYAAGLGTVFFTRLSSRAAYPLAILLLGIGRTPVAIIAIMASVGLVRASTSLVLPSLHLDRVSSDGIVTWIASKYRTVERLEMTVLLSVVCLPAAWILPRFF